MIIAPPAVSSATMIKPAKGDGNPADLLPGSNGGQKSDQPTV
jgi:hypothetical protein